MENIRWYVEEGLENLCLITVGCVVTHRLHQIPALETTGNGALSRTLHLLKD